MARLLHKRASTVAGAVLLLAGCPNDDDPDDTIVIADDIFAEAAGEAMPLATAEQLATFDRGREVALRRFAPEGGLGPTVNVAFCGACHERPTLGGGAPRYRDFYLHGTGLADGTFIPGEKGGVLTSYGFHGADIRPSVTDGANVFSHRNPIPFFGVGLLAELSEEAILANEDPDDADGDGISGRANYDRGFVGRFGRKSQTVSIEGFIRGPLNNHLGVTSDPLTEEQKGRLPVASCADCGEMMTPRQAAAPEEPLADADDVPDPELAGEDLFDLVSFAMLLAPLAPDPEPSEAAQSGAQRFGEIGCDSCHVATLAGSRGNIPLYSDLLLHDMGEELADGIVVNLATGSEFRTQPLWGIAAAGPYLHDGRADTLADAISMHGGEGKASADAFDALDEEARGELVAFLESLGGAAERSPGLLPPDSPIPPAGTPGAPSRLDSEAEQAQWVRGRALFDDDFTLDRGLGPVFNGDSCRACHFDPMDGTAPTVGGAGTIDVNVMRHGTLGPDGTFTAPAYGTILHKLTTYGIPRREHTDEFNFFETRQTPTTLGLGAIESIVRDDIIAGEDPDDLNGDGIRGVAHILPDGRLGRFGWKAQVPSIREFVRDAMTAEIGVTVPVEEGFTYGATTDDDGVPDPELSSAEIDDMAFFIARLAPPAPVEDVPGGVELFTDVGCATCHTPEFAGSEGPVAVYSDLLLHSVAIEGTPGIDDFAAVGTLFRTAPLWGVSGSAPYMHDGAATTIADAIAAHDGEAQAVTAAFNALSAADQALLLRFVESL